MPQQLRTTALIDRHRDAGARTVDFGGWDMPVHYGSQIEEHHAVRTDAGMFDVSHMTIVDTRGPRVRDFLRHLLANDVDKLRVSGKALYSCMLNERGGVVDDLIVYYLDDGFFRLVVNAATRDKDLPWIERHAAPFGVAIEEREDLAMLAIQGPNARAKAAATLPEDLREGAAQLKPFHALAAKRHFVARTGYTGEDGFEIVIPADGVVELWDALLEAGVRPCGLGARDTLRLEAGMHLYGQDMNEDTTPLETGLAWTVAFGDGGRDFVGRAALERQRAAGVSKKLVGLLLEGRGVLRAHQAVTTGSGGRGEVTSGTFSPTLKRAIGMAHVPADTGAHCEIDIRGKAIPASVHKLPFVRHGEIKIQL